MHTDLRAGMYAPGFTCPCVPTPTCQQGATHRLRHTGISAHPYTDTQPYTLPAPPAIAPHSPTHSTSCQQHPLLAPPCARFLLSRIVRLARGRLSTFPPTALKAMGGKGHVRLGLVTGQCTGSCSAVQVCMGRQRSVVTLTLAPAAASTKRVRLGWAGEEAARKVVRGTECTTQVDHWDPDRGVQFGRLGTRHGHPRGELLERGVEAKETRTPERGGAKPNFTARERGGFPLGRWVVVLTNVLYCNETRWVEKELLLAQLLAGREPSFRATQSNLQFSFLTEHLMTLDIIYFLFLFCQISGFFLYTV